jgi:hypothetical protein
MKNFQAKLKTRVVATAAAVIAAAGLGASLPAFA